MVDTQEHQPDTTGKVSAATGALCLLPGLLWFHAGGPLLFSLVFFLNLWVLSLYDWTYFRLPNLLTATLFATGAMRLVAVQPAQMSFYIIGAVVGLLFFPTLNYIYKRLRGRDGIGLGDAKLLAGIGLWLGWPALPIVLLIASVAGLLYGLYGVATKNHAVNVTKVPFGPFLCLGAWLSWLYI